MFPAACRVEFPGVPGGIPGGVAGGVAKASTTAQKSAKKPIKALLSQAVYAPDPKQSELQKTISARRSKKPGKNITSFCVSTSGKVVEVKTKKKFPGDPQVDKICRDTVRKWRFKPFIVGGKATKTCSAAEFDIVFK